VKRLVSTLLAAVIALVPVFAAAGVTYATYQNEAKGYSIDYPDIWALLDKYTMDSVRDALASGEMKIEGMDTSALDAYETQIDSTDMVMFMSADGAVSVNIIDSPVPMYTSDLVISTVCPEVLQQFRSMFPDFTPLSDPRVEMAGGLEFVETAGQYTLAGMNFITRQAYHCTDSTMYAITCTINSSLNPDMDSLEAILSDMLASFVPA